MPTHSQRLALTPIPTRYRGHHFRSRLEARYAVFLDALGVRWQYEPEGFQLPHCGSYLPDFWVEGFPIQRITGEKYTADFWLEIKAERPTFDSEEFAKLRELAVASGKHGFLAAATDLHRTVNWCSATAQVEFGVAPWWHSAMFEMRAKPYAQFRQSSTCGWPDVFAQDMEEEFRMDKIDPFLGEFHGQRWVEAAKAALSARFEHGHSGAS